MLQFDVIHHLDLIDENFKRLKMAVGLDALEKKKKYQKITKEIWVSHNLFHSLSIHTAKICHRYVFRTPCKNKFCRRFSASNVSFHRLTRVSPNFIHITDMT